MKTLKNRSNPKNYYVFWDCNPKNRYKFWDYDYFSLSL